MTLPFFCILLFAALLHASWNAIVKAGNDKLLRAAIGVSGSAAVGIGSFCPSFAAASSRQYPFLAVLPRSVAYTVPVAKNQVSDMSQTCPLMGASTAPLSAGGAH